MFSADGKIVLKAVKVVVVVVCNFASGAEAVIPVTAYFDGVFGDKRLRYEQTVDALLKRVCNSEETRWLCSVLIQCE